MKWPFRSRHRLDRAEQEIDDELSFHLARTIEEFEARGMSAEEARVAAAKRFGSMVAHRRNLVRLELHAESRIRRRALMDVIAVGIRSAFRGLRRDPGFAVGVCAVLTLGLGVNAITFGLIDRLILRGPAGVIAPDRVQRVVVHHRFQNGTEVPDTGYSYQDYRDLLQATGLAGAAGETTSPQLLGSGSTAERIRARFVTASYFSLLGASPAFGRFFTADESEREGARLVVLGYSVWQRRFAGDPGIIGQVLRIGSGSYTVVGVAPRNFTGSSVTKADVFLPLEAASDEVVSGAWQNDRGFGWMSAIVRLAPGVSPEAAEAEATALHRSAHKEGEARDLSEGRLEFAPLTAVRGATTPGDVSVAGLAAGIALLVLVIASANVANLFLARALRRSGELSVKLALGVGRLRMVSEQAVEGALLAVAGAIVAVLIALQGGPFIQRQLFPGVDWLETSVDVRGLVFIIACALIGGALAAGVPVWLTVRGDVGHRLKSAGQRATTRRTNTQATMLVVQGALSVLLLVGAGLFVRSLSELRRVDLGLDVDRLLIVQAARGDVAPRPDLMQVLRERVGHLAGVENTALVSGTVPFVSNWSVTLEVPGFTPTPGIETGGRYVQGASPEYFQTAGTAIIAGRQFTEADRAGAPLVAIVNDAMARLHWPGQSALGKCLKIGPGTPNCSTVVGIAKNTRRSEMIEGRALLYYIPLAQAPPAVASSTRRMVVRLTDADPVLMRSIAEAIRREALVLEPSLRYVGAQPLADVIAPQLHSWQLGATLFGVFGALALLVAAVGLFSVVAFDVEGRRREVGLRAALGAPPATILRLVMMGNVRVVGAGIALGLAIAWLAAPLVRGLLYGVSPHDGGVFAGVATTLVAASAFASALPALRAMRIDPVQALREE